MKLYIINETALEYNDEYYHTGEYDGGTPIAAFRSRENAEAECKIRTAAKKKEYESDAFEGGETPELFKVVEVNVEDSDVVGYSDRLAAKRKAAEEAAELAKAHLSTELAKVFSANPAMQAVRWTQYTPHFNDGESCTFSVHDVYVRFDDTPEDEGEYEDGFISPWRDEDPKAAPCKAAQTAVSSVDEDDMEKTFGDHVQVTAKRDGTFTVDEYSHD